MTIFIVVNLRMLKANIYSIINHVTNNSSSKDNKDVLLEILLSENCEGEVSFYTFI